MKTQARTVISVECGNSADLKKHLPGPVKFVRADVSRLPTLLSRNAGTIVIVEPEHRGGGCRSFDSSNETSPGQERGGQDGNLTLGFPARDIRDKRVDEYVRARMFLGNLRAQDVARIAALSRSAFYRYFRKRFGIPFSHFLQRARIEEAKKQLRETGDGLKCVAMNVGIPDVSYFGRLFKNCTRTTPGRYRSTLRHGAAVRVGVLIPFSGTYASVSRDMYQGAFLALEEMLGSSPVEFSLYPIDTETDPDIATQKVYEANKYLGIRHFVGCTSSAEAASISTLSREGNFLFVTSADQASACAPPSHYSFYWSVPSSRMVPELFERMMAKGKRFWRYLTITQDHVFGRNLLQVVQRALEETAIQNAGNIFHRWGERDFEPSLELARSAGADLVLLLNYGRETHEAIRKRNEMGLVEDMMLFIPWSMGIEEDLVREPAVIRNSYFGSQYWYQDTTKSNVDFSAAWAARYNFQPSVGAVARYAATRLVCQSIVGSRSTEVDANSSYLEQHSWSDLTSAEENIVPANHSTNKSFYLMYSQSIRRRSGSGSLLTCEKCPVSVSIG